jgi:hypothetical protein
LRKLAESDEMKLSKSSDMFAELLQIEDEFGELKYDLNDKTLSVITDPITLEGFAFGPFEIRLFVREIGRLYSESPYKAIALEPNRAAADENVTHPHVSSERVCEGDGHVTIIKAIEQGRLCDFYSMVVSILQTYNPDSPYVSLNDWQGVSCYDCGDIVSGDDCYYCECCDRDYCTRCSTYCHICETTICLCCAYSCPSCNKPACRGCTVKCKECEETFCEDCLTEDGMCKDCEEQRKDNENEEQKEESTESKPGVAVQSDSVGQAAVHA